MFDWFARVRRERLRSARFPAAWLAILERNVPLYKELSRPRQERVREDIQVLLAEKHFEGCGGLRLNNEIRVTIAAYGALLMLGGEPHCFAGHLTKLRQKNTASGGRLGMNSIFGRSANAALARRRRPEQP